MSDIVVRDMNTVEVVGEVLAHVDAKAMNYVQNSKAENTTRSYRADWDHFITWCESLGLQYLPTTSKTVARYLTAHAEQFKTSTMQRRLSAISQAHRQAGFAPISTRDEPLHSVWEGIRRAKGTAQKGKAPAVIDDIRAMVSTLPDTLIGTRDRALLLIGFAGAFRRSELVGLNVDDVEFTRDGLIVNLSRSKTDQEGEGRKIGIPYGSHPETCPVRSLQAWIEMSGIQSGALFRAVNRHGQLQIGRLSDKAVALVVKRSAQAAGLNAEQYAGHSLRAGLATSAAAAGVSERVIMAQTGHKSLNMVRRYIRDGNLFRENAAASVGL